MSCSHCLTREATTVHNLDSETSPRCSWTVNGSALRLTWTPSSRQVKKAHWEIVTDDEVLLLDHVVTISTRVNGETTDNRKNEPPLAEIPDSCLKRLQADGFKPTELKVEN